MSGTLAKVAIAKPFSGSALDASWAVLAQLVNVALNVCASSPNSCRRLKSLAVTAVFQRHNGCPAGSSDEKGPGLLGHSTVRVTQDLYICGDGDLFEGFYRVRE